MARRARNGSRLPVPRSGSRGGARAGQAGEARASPRTRIIPGFRPAPGARARRREPSASSPGDEEIIMTSELGNGGEGTKVFPLRGRGPDSGATSRPRSSRLRTRQVCPSRPSSGGHWAGDELSLDATDGSYRPAALPGDHLPCQGCKTRDRPGYTEDQARDQFCRRGGPQQTRQLRRRAATQVSER